MSITDVKNWNSFILSLMWSNLSIPYINILHDNGFVIGIHTNGYTPEILENVIDKIDYIGMDIKNDFSNYDEITKKKIDVEKIKKSGLSEIMI